MICVLYKVKSSDDEYAVLKSQPFNGKTDKKEVETLVDNQMKIERVWSDSAAAYFSDAEALSTHNRAHTMLLYARPLGTHD